MNRKHFAIIIGLAAVLTALLLWRPWESKPVVEPRFFDRLPEADILGKSKLLALSDSLSSTLYHYRIPGREFFTSEFILSQGKSFGLDVQKPVFFFMNEDHWKIQDVGVMCIVADSSLTRQGIEKLNKLLGIKDTLVHNYPVYKNPKHQLFFAYGKDWLLAYQGKHFDRTLKKVLFAKRNEIAPRWREFLNRTEHSDQPILAEAATKPLEEYGVTSTLFYLSNDSSTVSIHTEINTVDTLPFQLKEGNSGFASQEFTRILANIHIDHSQMKRNPNDPLVALLKKNGKKIGFPVMDLLNAWDGDLAFRQGGIQVIRERYIESELDDNFNVTEVVKYKNVKVPGFDVELSINERGEDLIYGLKKKGILTQSEGKYRLLFSPPLNMTLSDTTLTYHTGRFRPATTEVEPNTVIWEMNKTPYQFHLDSTRTRRVYGRVSIPLNQIVRDNIPHYDDL